MSPFEQELKYRQLKEEIEFYKSEREQKGWGYAIRLSIVFAIILLLFNLFIKVILGSKSFSLWFNDFDWLMLLINVLLLTLVNYFWNAQRTYRRLQKKMNEFQRFLIQNPHLKETTS
jgi:uncharacterized membrane protein YvlD (DUF360 family)